MKTCDFSTAKIGDKVWDFRLGDGVIKDIVKDPYYPLYIKFDSGVCENFNVSGYINDEDPRPTLFWQPIEIPDIAFQKPLPEIAVDTPLIVWDDNNFPGEKRHFSHFVENKVACFSNGQTSWTTDGDWDVWDNYEIIKTTGEIK